MPVSRTEYQYNDLLNKGNLTAVKTWNSNKNRASTPLSDPLTTSNSETVTHQYDGYGNRTLTIDALTNQTKYEYEAINGYTGLYVTRVTIGYGTNSARKQEYDYDFCTGLVICDRDGDNQVWTSTQYDKLGRPTLISAAAGTSAESKTWKEYLVGPEARASSPGRISKRRMIRNWFRSIIMIPSGESA